MGTNPKEKRCYHCENANKPQSNLTGMAGTDLESKRMLRAPRGLPRLTRDRIQHNNNNKKIPLSSSNSKNLRFSL